MLDRWTYAWVQGPLGLMSKKLPESVTPDRLTLGGFMIGLLAVPMLAAQWYIPALFMIMLNRTLDGLDGVLARLRTPTDAGGFLDITLDFVFYSAVILGFAFADPEQNAIAAAFLIFSFVCTGTSFLAFAVMAERNSIERIQFKSKSLHYAGGITEGTETLLFYAAVCLCPRYFPAMAWGFGSLCLITAGIRIYGGYRMLVNRRSNSIIK